MADIVLDPRTAAAGAHSLLGDRGRSPAREGEAERDERRTKDTAAFGAGPGRPSVVLQGRCIWPAMCPDCSYGGSSFPSSSGLNWASVCPSLYLLAGYDSKLSEGRQGHSLPAAVSDVLWRWRCSDSGRVDNCLFGGSCLRLWGEGWVSAEGPSCPRDPPSPS